MLKKLNNLFQKQPKAFVYADAAYDNKLAVIGYITSDLTVAKYELVNANNVNDAELKAVELAHKMFPNSKIATDSNYAIENTEGDYIGGAIAAITTPVIEVHISNIFRREDFKKI